MFLGENSKEEALFSRLSLFNEFSCDQKRKIFFTCAYNDARFFSEHNQKHQEVLAALKDWSISQNYSDLILFKIIEKFLDTVPQSFEFNLLIEKSNWLTSLSSTLSYASKNITENLWIQSILRNFILYTNGFCPLLNFSFGTWHWEDYSPDKLSDIIELSTTYLYRLIPPRSKTQHERKSTHEEGAYCFIVKQKSGSNFSSTICKVPKNLAAEFFVNQQEARVLKYASFTPLRFYIPNFVKYDIQTGILYRTYIEGVLGHKLLNTTFFSDNPESIINLEKIYNLFREQIYPLGIYLDIHPSNFIWSYKFKSWFLIDLGPTPKIGSDYFLWTSFELYFKKVWIERYERMMIEPIRSVNLHF